MNFNYACCDNRVDVVVTDETQFTVSCVIFLQQRYYPLLLLLKEHLTVIIKE